MDNISTHLPVISIDTRGQEIPHGSVLSVPWLEEDEYTIPYARIRPAQSETEEADEESDFETSEEPEKILVSIAFYNGKSNGAQVNPFLREPTIDTDALISYRGRSSLQFPKKGISIKLMKSSNEEDPREVFGMRQHNEWVLNGPYLDKTLIRNYLMYNICGEVMAYAPNVRFCELFVNNEYLGLYLLIEKITMSDYGRVPITRTRTGERTTSYILELMERQPPEGRSIPQNYSHYAYFMASTQEFEVRSPAYKNITPEQLEYIQNDLSRFEKVIYSYDYDDPDSGYSSLIDVNNFVDYAILNMFCANTDAGNLSTFVYKDPKGKFSLCVWDYNNVFDNFFRRHSYGSESLSFLRQNAQDVNNAFDEYPTDDRANNEFFLSDRLWFDRLMRDEDFTRLLVYRYRNLRGGVLGEEYLLNYIDDTIAYLGPAIERNYSVWATSFLTENDLLIPATRNLHSFDDAVAQLKSEIIHNGDWFDANIESIYQFSHESAVKQLNP